MRLAEIGSNGTTRLQYLQRSEDCRSHAAIDGNHDKMQCSGGLGRIRTIDGALCTPWSLPLDAQWARSMANSGICREGANGRRDHSGLLRVVGSLLSLSL